MTYEIVGITDELREAVTRIGKPVEIWVNSNLPEGSMYIVDTTVDTEFWEADPDGVLALVHCGLDGEAHALKDALDEILAQNSAQA